MRSPNHIYNICRISAYEVVFFMFSNIKCGTSWWARKRIHYSCEDGMEKSVPRDHRSSSLGKPRDAIRWFSGRTFLSHPLDLWMSVDPAPISGNFWPLWLLNTTIYMPQMRHFSPLRSIALSCNIFTYVTLKILSKILVPMLKYS